MEFPNIQGVSSLASFITSRLSQLSSCGNLYALFANYNNLHVSVGAHSSDLDIVFQAGYDFGFNAVEEKIGPLPADRPILAVVYAGLSAWRESLDFAVHVKEQRPQASVVIVTCDCGLHRKMPTFSALLDAGKIDEVVIDKYCGGHAAMTDIIHRLAVQHPPDTIT